MKKRQGKNNKHPFRLSSAQYIPLGFLALIIIGTLLLMIPAATAPGEKTTFLTALFTSTTSVCVTGSVVVDTYLHWSLFGKVIILALIQLGGLGLISVLAILALIARKQFSLSQVLLLKDTFNLTSTRGVLKFLKRVFIGTLIVEAIGGIGYMPVLIPQFGVLRGIWYSFFTAVSAFCNAGIDIIGPDSLIRYNNNPLIMIVTMVMIVMGGIGYVVWFELAGFWKSFVGKKKRSKSSYRRVREHTRLVLFLTAALIAIGAVLIFLLEYRNPDTIGTMPVGQKIINSIFQSVTFRTAGFTTVPQGALTEATCVVGDLLMFIGGSPVGTAGGVKTVTIFVLILSVMAFVRNKSEVTFLKRSIPLELLRKATAIVTVHFFFAFVFCLALMMATGASLNDSMYEIMSAVSTVGLSRGLTPLLNPAGRVIVILAMYFGRIGPISMFLFFTTKKGRSDGVRLAQGNYIVG